MLARPASASLPQLARLFCTAAMTSALAMSTSTRTAHAQTAPPAAERLRDYSQYERQTLTEVLQQLSSSVDPAPEGKVIERVEIEELGHSPRQPAGIAGQPCLAIQHVLDRLVGGVELLRNRLKGPPVRRSKRDGHVAADAQIADRPAAEQSKITHLSDDRADVHRMPQ